MTRQFNVGDICRLSQRYYEEYVLPYTDNTDARKRENIDKIVYIIYEVVNVTTFLDKQSDGLYHSPGLYYVLQSDVLITCAVQDGRRLIQCEWLKHVVI